MSMKTDILLCLCTQGASKVFSFRKRVLIFFHPTTSYLQSEYIEVNSGPHRLPGTLPLAVAALSLQDLLSEALWSRHPKL